MDEEKLGKYVESFYSLRDQNYGVRTHSSDKFFQITLEHLREESPDLEKLKEDILDSLALDRDTWELETEERDNYSYMYGSEEFSDL